VPTVSRRLVVRERCHAQRGGGETTKRQAKKEGVGRQKTGSSHPGQLPLLLWVAT